MNFTPPDQSTDTPEFKEAIYQEIAGLVAECCNEAGIVTFAAFEEKFKEQAYQDDVVWIRRDIPVSRFRSPRHVAAPIHPVPHY